MNSEIALHIANLESYIEKVVEFGDKYDFIDPAYNTTDELMLLENPIAAVEPIFMLLERSPDINYGAPGPLGTFIETYYKNGYEELLLASLSRKPVPYTVYLLHRLVNDKNNPKRSDYLNLMKSIAQNANIAENARNIAVNSLKYFE